MRLFVALEIAESTREALAGWQKLLVRAGGGDLRAASPETLHVTLAFLGHRYERETAKIGACVESVAARPVPLAFAPEIAPRPMRRPQLYAAAVLPTDQLMGLRAEVAAVLTERAGFTDDRREYWPHVTLCRVKSSVRRHPALHDPPRAPAPLLRPAAAAAMTLFKSELLPQGSTHTPLMSVALPALDV